MESKHQERAWRRGESMHPQPILAGLVIGALAGAAAVLFLAPQSGRETRSQIKQRTSELRDRTAETFDEKVAQLKSKTHQITEGVHGMTEEFQHQGQEILIKQLDSVVAAAEAGKAVLHGS